MNLLAMALVFALNSFLLVCLMYSCPLKRATGFIALCFDVKNLDYFELPQEIPVLAWLLHQQYLLC